MNAGWRPSYQRRGFVSIKTESVARPFALPTLEHAPALARRLCLSLGKVASSHEAAGIITGAVHPQGSVPIVHHVRLTRGRLECVAGMNERPAIGQWVGTVVELGPDEFWTGIHRHAALVSPDPGGSGFLTLPDDAPSRAWLKLEEAVRFFGLQFGSGDTAVETGCAPGGVIHALLQRKISVIGVDPAKLAPSVMVHAVSALSDPPPESPWVFHCRKPAALVAKRDLPARVTWFLSDMNQSPAVALRECARFINMRPSIRSALITLKLTDLAQVVEKHLWFQSLRDMGFKTIRLQQLAVHNRELALLALDRSAVGSKC
jgi:hypothetical protein